MTAYPPITLRTGDSLTVDGPATITYETALSWGVGPFGAEDTPPASPAIVLTVRPAS